jgi:hypothetical protein
VHVQSLISVVKMATVLDGCIIEEQLSVVRFILLLLLKKGLNSKDIHKEIFPAYDGKCLARKAVHDWVEKFSQGLSNVTDDARPRAELLETTVKRLVCCGFRRTDKTMRPVYQCWWTICREINVIPRFEYHNFRLFYIQL